MKRRVILFVAIIIITAMNVRSQEIVKLWSPNSPIGASIVKGSDEEKEDKQSRWTTNVSNPELHIYKAKENKDGTVVVICPGGGYSGLAMGHEGEDFAIWLNGKGITAVVLKYRMPNQNSQVPIEDGHQAIRYVRGHAKELGIDENKIGVAGFSAGGHLASTISTHYGTEGISTRPDFAILFYPVITMNQATHGGSRTNLLGENPSSVAKHRFSNEEQVTVNTPPTILLLSDDDESVPVMNSIWYYDALKKNNISAAMYIFPEGGHGWGFRKSFKYHEEMKTLLGKWLDDLWYNI